MFSAKLLLLLLLLLLLVVLLLLLHVDLALHREALREDMLRLLLLLLLLLLLVVHEVWHAGLLHVEHLLASLVDHEWSKHVLLSAIVWILLGTTLKLSLACWLLLHGELTSRSTVLVKALEGWVHWNWKLALCAKVDVRFSSSSRAALVSSSLVHHWLLRL